MRTESFLVAAIADQRPVIASSEVQPPPVVATAENHQRLLAEVQTATKIINEIFVEASFHRQEFARLKAKTPTSPHEEKLFAENFRTWFSKEIRSTINQMPGASQSVACYVLKDRLERFPIFNAQWTPPFVRNGTVLEKFMVAQSPILLSQLGEVGNLLTRHKTNATPDELTKVEQWQAVINDLAHTVVAGKKLKI